MKWKDILHSFRFLMSILDCFEEKTRQIPCWNRLQLHIWLYQVILPFKRTTSKLTTEQQKQQTKCTGAKYKLLMAYVTSPANRTVLYVQYVAVTELSVHSKKFPAHAVDMGGVITSSMHAQVLSGVSQREAQFPLQRLWESNLAAV